jgi:hypothetical protein
VLIGDNLAAHLSPVVTELCQQHNIRYGMVPYCTSTYGTVLSEFSALNTLP